MKTLITDDQILVAHNGDVWSVSVILPDGTYIGVGCATEAEVQGAKAQVLERCAELLSVAEGMSLPEIRAAIEELRRATRPEQRSVYERALLALADLVDQLTQRDMALIQDLRAAVHVRKKTSEAARLRQLLRDLVDFNMGEPPDIDALCAIEGPRKLARMASAWQAAIAEVGSRNQSRYEGDTP